MERVKFVVIITTAIASTIPETSATIMGYYRYLVDLSTLPLQGIHFSILRDPIGCHIESKGEWAIDPLDTTPKFRAVGFSTANVLRWRAMHPSDLPTLVCWRRRFVPCVSAEPRRRRGSFCSSSLWFWVLRPCLCSTWGMVRRTSGVRHRRTSPPRSQTPPRSRG